MKEKILQTITAVVLIMTMTMANFILLGANAVSYALDAIQLDKSTSHKNVEFMTYFVDGNGNQVTNTKTAMNAQDLKLQMKVGVKQEGYFNGTITLDTGNFRLKPEIMSEGISKIEGNTITLNQINSGETKELTVGIEMLKDSPFNLSLLTRESVLSIHGTYKDSTQKDIEIKGSRTVTMQLISPYNDQNVGSKLTQSLLTNQVITREGKQKRMIQLKVDVGIDGNAFPIQSTKVELVAPKIKDTYPSEVLVTSMDILATNGKNITDQDWNYAKETGKITIEAKNEAKDNQVNWEKSGQDSYIVTYFFDEIQTPISEQKLSANAEITLYDEAKTKLTANQEMTINNEEKNDMVTVEVNNQEKEIAKGKLYAGLDREIKQTIALNVTVDKIATRITLTEDNSALGLRQVTTKQTTFKAEQIKSILGEQGKVTILNAETQEVLAEINNQTLANPDQDGNITVNYPEGIKQLTVIFSEPVKPGKIEMSQTKIIHTHTVQEVKGHSKMTFGLMGSYSLGETQIQMTPAKSILALTETQTSARFEISRTDLSTMVPNKNVEMRVILQNREEKNELFKNPVITITLPEQIEDIQVNSINLLYKNGLEIGTPTLKGNTIEIPLLGDQTIYQEEAIEGTTLIINADLTINKKSRSSEEAITYTYTNQKAIHYQDEKAIGEGEQKISIISYAGMVTANTITEYGLESINKEGTKTAKLALGTDSKQATFTGEMINNHKLSISNLRVLGTFPTKQTTEENNIAIEVGPISVQGIDSNRVKIYYSENAKATNDLGEAQNGWSETITNPSQVKKYLMIIEKLELQEELKFSYTLTIPANLEYNQMAKQGYEVSYINDETAVEAQVAYDEMTLETGKGPVMETKLTALVGGKESQTAKVGQIIKFTMTATNTGSEPVTNATIKAVIPEGLVYVEEVDSTVNTDGGYTQKPEQKEVNYTIDELKPGQSITKSFETMVLSSAENKQITMKANTSYGEVKKDSNEIKLAIEKSDIQVILSSVDTTGPVQAGYVYRYAASIKNDSGHDMTNVNVQMKTEGVKLQQLLYIDGKGQSISATENKLTIDTLKAGETATVSAYAEILPFTEGSKKDVFLQAIVTANGETYESNQKEQVADAVQIELTHTSSNQGQYVKSGETITYQMKVTNTGNKTIKQFTIQDQLSQLVEFLGIAKEGTPLSEDSYSLEPNLENNTKSVVVSDSLAVGESKTYELTVTVNRIPQNTEAMEIINVAEVFVNYVQLKQEKITHLLAPESENQVDPEDPDNPVNPDDPEENQTKVVSGVAWLDENGNGQKDDKEQLLGNIPVKLWDTKTNTVAKDKDGNEITTTTNQEGFYSLSKIPQGEYIVVFEYDTSKYSLTTYQKEGVNSQYNSKVISKTMTIDGQEKNVGTTEIIVIHEENIAHINLGLIVAKTFDLRLDKTVSKIIVQNAKGTVTQEYEDATLAKAEIDAKQINNTTVIIEYKIKLTNEGEVDAYVRKIVDNLATDLKFSSELNKDWYVSGEKLYNSSLANEKIRPGESKTVTLTVTKKMTENNTGLVNNTAEIVESYNEQGLPDIDSVAGNQAIGEDDWGSADVILSIKTGQIAITITFIITTIIILSVGAYVIARIVLKKKVI